MTKRPLCLTCLVLILGIIFLLSNKLNPKEEFEGQEKSIICRVDSIEGLGKNISFLARDIKDSQGRLCEKIKIYFNKDNNALLDVKIGNIISLDGKIYSFQKATNPGQFDLSKYYGQQGLYYYFSADNLKVIDPSYDLLKEKIHQVKNLLINKVLEILPEKESGSIIAMIFGEKALLDDDIKNLYKDMGIGHILAISGLHISFIGIFLFTIFRKYFFHMKISAIITMMLLLIYGILIGFPISATRAIVMMWCMLLAKFLGKRYDLYCALALSAIIQIIIMPEIIYQTGFLLSYGTVLGISIFVSSLENKNKYKNSIYRNPLMDGIVAAFGIFLVNLPIILYSYYSFSPYSFIINILILPFLSLLIVSAILGIGFTFIFIGISKFISGTTYFLFYYYDLICNFFANLPFSEIVVGQPEIWRILIYYILLIVYSLLIKKTKRRFLFLPLAVLLLMILLFNPNFDGKLYIYNLDIGQGDCEVILNREKTIIIDCGSTDNKNVGRDRLVSFLKYKGRGRIDYIFLTHSDADHINGLLEILEDKRKMGIQINKVILPHISKKSEAYQNLEKAILDSKTKIFYMEKGQTLNINELKISCLHPYSLYDYEDENDYSLTLKLDFRNFTALFTGDLGKKGEEEIMNNLEKVDYLKVGHHGSKNSSCQEFLDKLSPKVATISAGKNNRYGHPAQETLDRLKKAGCRIWTTIKSGAITTETDGNNIRVKEFVKSD